MLQRCTILLAVSAAAAPARAADLLSAEELRAEFAGQTITGYYLADNVRFIEVYKADGGIAYKDDLKADIGRWSIRQHMFCTFYDRINGACWHVRKVTANCYEFFPDDSGLPLMTPEERTAYTPTARAAREGRQITCDSWLGS